MIVVAYSYYVYVHLYYEDDRMVYPTNIQNFKTRF